MIRSVVAAGVLSVMMGSAALAAPGDELIGNSLQVRITSFDGSGHGVAFFETGGRVHVVRGNSADGLAADSGTYTVANDQVCFTWMRQGNECWRYPETLQFDRETAASSVDATPVTALMTLRRGHDHGLPGPAPRP